ncbi:hypothetical protein AURDEDRAFT_176869 [Auricularia subglabra TFB-10046 SS5]|uniref:Uncharacterized protein n=1 Tax=Auricularia subglabra (strain TFB-10046 / SS5) TaxID=717982 RepID=J0D5M7_AURST|nr:hypothetical protein AURDEDRAFT_176869 [Auricularia subglabra TFB-10046 SS5]
MSAPLYRAFHPYDSDPPFHTSPCVFHRSFAFTGVLPCTQMFSHNLSVLEVDNHLWPTDPSVVSSPNLIVLSLIIPFDETHDYNPQYLDIHTPLTAVRCPSLRYLAFRSGFVSPDEASPELFWDFPFWDSFAIDARSVRLLGHLEPGEEHIYATVFHPSSRRHYPVTGNVYPFFHAGCVNIFARVLELSPRTLTNQEQVLWAVVRRHNLYTPSISGINGVIYGREVDLTQTMSEFVARLANAQYACRIEEGLLPPPIVRCFEQGVYPPGIVHDWWCGSGAMFMFVCPDRFPIDAAYSHPFTPKQLLPCTGGTSELEQLPIELLTMIGESFAKLADLGSFLVVSKTIRQRCLASVNMLVHALAPEWSRPPPRLLAALKTNGRPSFPWLQYIHYCTTASPSMRNRSRIFGLCQQIMELAQEMADDELGHSTWA